MFQYIEDWHVVDIGIGLHVTNILLLVYISLNLNKSLSCIYDMGYNRNCLGRLIVLFLSENMAARYIVSVKSGWCLALITHDMADIVAPSAVAR